VKHEEGGAAPAKPKATPEDNADDIPW